MKELENNYSELMKKQDKIINLKYNIPTLNINSLETKQTNNFDSENSFEEDSLIFKLKKAQEMEKIYIELKLKKPKKDISNSDLETNSNTNKPKEKKEKKI